MNYYNRLLDKKREIEHYLNNSVEMRILEKSEKNKNQEFYYNDFVSGCKVKVLRKDKNNVVICDGKAYKIEELEIKRHDMYNKLMVVKSLIREEENRKIEAVKIKNDKYISIIESVDFDKIEIDYKKYIRVLTKERILNELKRYNAIIDRDIGRIIDDIEELKNKKIIKEKYYKIEIM